ncbi:C40 family peptidase [Microlunatus parietis]|uniref:Cell wall-associated NlpC family hydrolase n=1 Tax=Microlunatus parietis TaxID=682979 RepID=A0A7Y9I6Q0_9ACTN|nr:peptidoglycan-binding protein [Microlunatus parietis]NYE71287.1 cell wall-associated NlpC family hydrolase [Microlunatus parietis]
MRRIAKILVSGVASVALALTIGIGSAATADAAAKCTTALKSYGHVKKGTKSKSAKAAECLLKSAGYKGIKTNGKFSAAEVKALKKFQGKVKLSKTGTMNRRTWVALLSRGSKPTLRYGDKSKSVKRLQSALTASGRKVPATGYFGPITRDAVKSLQRSQGWKASGKATAGVWRALQAGAEVKVKTSKPKKKKKKSSSSSKGSKGEIALAFAKKQIGDRYSYGGDGPSSWDCSGLTQAAWRKAGIKLPHSAGGQFRKGKKIKKSDLKKGDLVFFYSGISHVGIYAGNGKVLHASRPGKPVGYIKMSYMPYQGARRY